MMSDDPTDALRDRFRELNLRMPHSRSECRRLAIQKPEHEALYRELCELIGNHPTPMPPPCQIPSSSSSTTTP